jgi:hypothetical protein
LDYDSLGKLFTSCLQAGLLVAKFAHFLFREHLWLPKSHSERTRLAPKINVNTEITAPSLQDMAPAYDNFHKFPQLPTELKVIILRERLLISSTITELAHASHSSRVLLGLIRVNKELQALASEIYYGENAF